MGIKGRVMRKKKVRLIKSHIQKVDLVLAQTDVINRRLCEKF